MFPNIDPKKMQAVMKQMGIAQTEIPASRVVIEKTDGGKLTIENPSVTRIKMQGNESFQISGDVKEENEENDFSEEDIKTIMEKTGCSEEEALDALEETGDLAGAILKLSE
ncbi:MAG: nascent polypeptide-associated complex protein [Candidatus Nanoarchaeia archaeon]|nr:nascent polypeptide-associated complex protein [Candidatus Nanoarchaeia archaeon]